MEGLANKHLVDFDSAFRYPMYGRVKEDLRIPVLGESSSRPLKRALKRNR